MSLFHRHPFGKCPAAILLALHICAQISPAQNQATQQSALEQDLRRQLEIERAARKALTYQADMRKSAQLAESEDWSALRTLLDGYRPAAGATDLRKWEWHFLDSLARKAQLVDGRILALDGPNEGIHQLAWSGNGERLAGIGEDGEVVLWDLLSRKELRRLGGGARFVAWNRDGSRLTVSSKNGTVSLWSSSPGPSRRSFGPVQGMYDFRQPAFSADGRMVAVPSDPSNAVINSAVTGLELHRLRGHRDFISVVAWDPKGQRLATGSNDETIKIRSAADGHEITTLATLGSVFGLRWSDDGRQIAAVIWPSNGIRQVGIWDLERRERVFTALTPGGTYRPNQRPSALLFSSDGARLAAETNDGVTVWETATARPIFQIRTGPRFSPLDGCDPGVRRWASLETVGSRATCRVVDMDTSQELMNVEVEIPMNRYQAALAWSPDGRRIAIGLSQGRVLLYDVAGRPIETRATNCGPADLFAWSPDGRSFAFKTGGALRLARVTGSTEAPRRVGPSIFLPDVLSLSPNGEMLAAADHDGRVPIWNISSGEIIKCLPGHPGPIAHSRGDKASVVDALVWSPGGESLATLRYSDGSVVLWDVKTGNVRTAFRFGNRDLPAGADNPPPLVWSPDARQIAVRSGWPTRKFRVCDASTGKELRRWEGGPDLESSNAMAWDPTGKKLATCLGTSPRVQVRDMTTGETTLIIDDQVPDLRRMSWSPDGLRLAYLQHNQWRVCDLATGQITPIEGNGERLVWKPDGTQVALLGSGSSIVGALGFYDPATGRLTPGERGFDRPDARALGLPQGATDRFNLRIQSVVWTGNRILAAADGSPYPGTGIRFVWEVKTGKPLWKLGQPFEAPENRARVARSIAWAPDGRSLATLGGDTLDDCRIEIWDVATLRKTQTLTGSRINFRNTATLAFSPDGRSLACAARDIQVWKLAAPGAPISLLQPGRTGDEAEQIFLAWSPDSMSLAALECRQTMGHEALLTGWDLNSGKPRFSWKRPYEFSYLHAPIAWSPDGSRLAWGGPKPAVLNVKSGTEEFPIAGHGAPVVEVAWSADGTRLITRAEIFGGFRPDFELKVWDTAERQEVLMVRGKKAGWLVAPGFGALAGAPGRGSEPGDVLVWDLSPRN